MFWEVALRSIILIAFMGAVVVLIWLASLIDQDGTVIVALLIAAIVLQVYIGVARERARKQAGGKS
jgi:hypothetical protein